MSEDTKPKGRRGHPVRGRNVAGQMRAIFAKGYVRRGRNGKPQPVKGGPKARAAAASMNRGRKFKNSGLGRKVTTQSVERTDWKGTAAKAKPVKAPTAARAKVVTRKKAGEVQPVTRAQATSRVTARASADRQLRVAKGLLQLERFSQTPNGLLATRDLISASKVKKGGTIREINQQRVSMRRNGVGYSQRADALVDRMQDKKYGRYGHRMLDGVEEGLMNRRGYVYKGKEMDMLPMGSAREAMQGRARAALMTQYTAGRRAVSKRFYAEELRNGSIVRPMQNARPGTRRKKWRVSK